jgi:hypothetical protein
MLAVTTAAAQQVVTGTVVRIDPTASVVVLDNGMMYQGTPQTVVLVNNQPTSFAALAPGTPVVLHAGQPVAYRDGRYVVMTHPGSVRTADGLYEVSGVVKYSHAGRGMIRFEDGRDVVIDEHTQVLAGGVPAMLSTLQPGTFVVVRSSRPFALRDGAYAVVANAPAVGTTPPTVVSGTVLRFDQPNVIVLSDGRAVPATAHTTVMVDNRAVPYTALQPGSRVVIYPNGHPNGAAVAEPSALPAAVSPEIGLREKALERNAP